MMGMDELAEWVGKVLREDPNIEILSPLQKGAQCLRGEIRLSLNGHALLVKMTIPDYFPLNGLANTSITFCCPEIDGYPHQNPNRTLCLHPEACEDPHEKFISELALLKEWVQRFYINGEIDPEESLRFHEINDSPLLPICYTQVRRKFLPGEVGYFEYTLEVGQLKIYIQRLGGQICNWAPWLLDKKRQSFRGMWLYLGREPVAYRRKAIETWEELRPLLSPGQLEQLGRLAEKNGRQPFYPILIGFPPFKNPEVVRWQALCLFHTSTPIQRQKSTYQLFPEPLQWWRSHDLSYENFFGRGAMNQTFCKANILILGLGAIGSKLAEHLVRGGVRRLAICDFDVVEPGNICRSVYGVHAVGFPKTIALQAFLQQISPFADISIQEAFQPVVRANDRFDPLRRNLSAYDYIFDCSTDMSLAWTLDEMQLPGQIINLSISNKAQQLFACTGPRIAAEKARVVAQYQQPEDSDLFREQGCAYPTFRASDVDISSLLSAALRNIDWRMKQGLSIHSFIVHTSESEGNLGLRIENF